MEVSVSAQTKKNFISWFLTNNGMCKKECRWLLKYLWSQFEFLKRVHFVDDISFTPRGVIISSQPDEKDTFLFAKEGVTTTDLEKSFHDIRSNHDDPLYIQLHFPQSRQSIHYHAVLEENPYLPEAYSITEEDSRLADQLLDYTIKVSREKQLKKAIDEALETNDRERFLALSEQLQILLQQSHT